MWNIKHMMLSHMKHKEDDVESYKHANRYWYTEAQTCKKARGWLSKRVIHPKLKRKNTGSQKSTYREKTMMHLKPNIKHMHFGMHYDEWKEACKRFWVMKTAQCSWHSFILCWTFFFCKTQIDCLFLKDVMIHAILSYVLHIFLETPLEYMFCLIQPLGSGVIGLKC